MKLIELYKKWMKTGLLPHWGLCKSLPYKYKKLFELVSPTEEDKSRYNLLNYWGCDKTIENVSETELTDSFTPLRQTIVLFICAMHDEL
jgi:hypothetical protein